MAIYLNLRDVSCFRRPGPVSDVHPKALLAIRRVMPALLSPTRCGSAGVQRWGEIVPILTRIIGLCISEIVWVLCWSS